MMGNGGESQPRRPGLRAVVALCIGLFLLFEGVSILTAVPPWLLVVELESGPAESLRATVVRWLDSDTGRELLALQPLASAASLLALLLAIAVVSGGAAQRWRRYGRTKTSVGLAALTLVLLAYAVGKPVVLHGWVSRFMSRAKVEGAAASRHLREGLDSGRVPAAHRDAAWRLYASGVFVDTGERVEIPAPGGGTRPYEPTAGEIRFRDMRESILTEMRPSWRPAAAWGGVAAAGAAAGFRIARRRSGPAAPSSAS